MMTLFLANHYFHTLQVAAPGGKVLCDLDELGLENLRHRSHSRRKVMIFQPQDYEEVPWFLTLASLFY